jgi:hypothetical protein
MMPKRKSLSDLVSSRIPKRGPPIWETHIDPELKAELEAEFAAFSQGLRGTPNGFANAITESLNELGVNIGIRGVQAWMRRSAKG